MSQAIHDAYLADIDSPATGPQHLPGITQCARHACRLGRITTQELTAILSRAEEREKELAVPASVSPKQKSLF
jgi:hypothetical protein